MLKKDLIHQIMNVIDHKKVIGLMKDELGVKIRICCFKTKNIFLFNG